MNEEDILRLVKADSWMMEVMFQAEGVGLRDWVIGAGFLRNKIWNHLHGYNEEVIQNAETDIDLVYYDPEGNDQESDESLSLKIKKETGRNFEIVNQFYAHQWNEIPPYVSIEDAISQWPETATAIGITLENKELKLIAPYGIGDLVSLVIRESPNFKGTFERNIGLVKKRVEEKQWLRKYPKLKMVSATIPPC
jgi:hypothetical protein